MSVAVVRLAERSWTHFCRRYEKLRKAEAILRGRILIAPFLLILFLSADAHPQAPLAEDWFGTWHLNIPRSTFQQGTPPYSRGTWKVSRGPDDQIMMIYDHIGVRGGVTHMEWKGRFDGRDHRLQGPDALVTYAYSQVDERTLNLLVKVDGRPAATAKVVLSADGIVTATTANATASGTVTTVTVYEKKR